MLIDILIFVVTICVTHFLIITMRKPKNFPNGPIFYPIIGNLFTIGKLRKETGFLIRAVMKIAEQYTNTKDVVGLKIGKDRVVFTLTTKAMKEMYTCQDFDGRPFGPFYETRTFNKRLGIVLTDQEFYQVQHRFVVRQLKEFGFARKAMLEICESEAEFCVNDFRKLIENQGGKSATVNMPNILTSYILNTLWHFMAGIRYDVDNKEMRYLQGILSDLMKSIDMKGALFSHFPFLQYIAPEASGYKNYVKCHKNIHAFMRKEVERHKRNFNPLDEPRDLIEAYLKVLHVGDESGKAHNSFDELQLLAICLDMFVAGSETTNNASNFMMLHLTRSPHVQKRAREEIDRVIGRNRLPKLSDRPNLPYCEAIVHESLRTFEKLMCGIPHRALKDTKLCGFDIPKDTMIIASFMPPLTDTKYFKNPHKFDPENFLDENGNILVPENFIPFALGKRRCIGEVLAKTNLFLLCTTLIQNFYFEIPDGHDLPSEEPIDGVTPNVKDYEAMIVLRQ